jgi:hypothetical protein
MSTDNPVSPKTIAATTGAGLGAALSTLVTWVLGVTFWDASTDAAKATDAVAAVPAPVSAVIVLLIPAALAAFSGWRITDPNRVSTEDLHKLRSLKNQP